MRTLTAQRHNDAAGVVGPNAVLQLQAAMRAAGFGEQLEPLFADVDALDWLVDPPSVMVDERRVARLHQRVRSAFPPARARALLTDAGLRTADYLLAVRIPRPAQALLKLLPPRIAAVLLTQAIRKNAWTFAGTGVFTAVVGGSVEIAIRGNPFCAGEQAQTKVCCWHQAVFARLYTTLVSPKVRVSELACEAMGNDGCRFSVRWR